MSQEGLSRIMQINFFKSIFFILKLYPYFQVILKMQVKAHSLKKISQKPIYIRTYSRKNKVLDEKVFNRLNRPFASLHKYPKKSSENFPKEDKAWKEFLSEVQFKIQHNKYLRANFSDYAGFCLMERHTNIRPITTTQKKERKRTRKQK